MSDRIAQIPGVFYGLLPEHPDVATPEFDPDWATVDIPVVMIDVDQLTPESFIGTQLEGRLGQFSFPRESWEPWMLAELIWPKTFDVADREQRRSASLQLLYGLERLVQFNRDVLEASHFHPEDEDPGERRERFVPSGQILVVPFEGISYDPEENDLPQLDTEDDILKRFRVIHWSRHVTGDHVFRAPDDVRRVLSSYRSRLREIEQKLAEWREDTVDRIQVMTDRLSRIAVVGEAMLACADLTVNDGTISSVTPGKKRRAWAAHTHVPLEDGSSVDLNNYLHAPFAWDPPTNVHPWPLVATTHTDGLRKIIDKAKELAVLCTAELPKAAQESELLKEAGELAMSLLQDLADSPTVEVALRQWKIFPYQSELEDILVDAVTLASMAGQKKKIFETLSLPLLILISANEHDVSPFEDLPFVRAIEPHPLAVKLRSIYLTYGKIGPSTGAIIPKLARAALGEIAILMKIPELHDISSAEFSRKWAQATAWAVARSVNTRDLLLEGNVSALTKHAGAVQEQLENLALAKSVKDKQNAIRELRRKTYSAAGHIFDGPMARSVDVMFSLILLQHAYLQSNNDDSAENIAKTMLALTRVLDRSVNALLWLPDKAKVLRDPRLGLKQLNRFYNELELIEDITDYVGEGALAKNIKANLLGAKVPIGFLLDAVYLGIATFEFIRAKSRFDELSARKHGEYARAAVVGLIGTIVGVGLGPVGGLLLAAGVVAAQYFIINSNDPPKSGPAAFILHGLKTSSEAYNGSKCYTQLSTQGTARSDTQLASPEDAAATVNDKLSSLEARVRHSQIWRIGCFEFRGTGIVKEFAPYHGGDLRGICRALLHEVYGLERDEAEQIVGPNRLVINETKPPSSPVELG